MGIQSMNSVLGTSYTSEDSDLVATEQSYAAMENELQSEIDNIETTHSGYDEYRYDLDTIGHQPLPFSFPRSKSRINQGFICPYCVT